jgi:ketosteroid isomerase-like protein
MTQENVEICRRANDAFMRGDLKGFFGCYAEDVEVEDLLNAPDVPSVIHGKQGFREMIMAWVETFDEIRANVVEYIDEGSHVVCVTDYYFKSRGLTTHQRVSDVVEIREGKVGRVTFGYSTRDEALEAVGLSE